MEAFVIRSRNEWQGYEAGGHTLDLSFPVVYLPGTFLGAREDGSAPLAAGAVSRSLHFWGGAMVSFLMTSLSLGLVFGAFANVTIPSFCLSLFNKLFTRISHTFKQIVLE